MKLYEIVESRPQDPMVTVNLRFLFADDPMMPGFLMSACFSRRKWTHSLHWDPADRMECFFMAAPGPWWFTLRCAIWGFPKMKVYTPRSSILIGLSIINHQFWGTPILGNHHIKPSLGRYSCVSLSYLPLGPIPSRGCLPSQMVWFSSVASEGHRRYAHNIQ